MQSIRLSVVSGETKGRIGVFSLGRNHFNTMNKRDLPEIRCPYCNKLIARGEALDMEFRCGRCKNFFILRAARLNDEGRGASLQETPCLQPANHSIPRS